MNEHIVVAVSGGFDPIHPGHLEYIRRAKELGTYLVVILNNDNWLVNKKGYAFMSARDREAILRSLRSVDEVVVTDHALGENDTSVTRALRELKPHIFGNGGDRKTYNTPEDELCAELGITAVYELGEKISSSSELVRAAHEQILRREREIAGA
jgi:cytidyltransferase-like protein